MPMGLHRLYHTGHLHFITFSCYHRRPLLGSAQRRNLFLKIFEQVRHRYSFVVIGYVVMPEHVHLLISEPDKGTQSTVMQVLKQRFARRVLSNQRKQRSSRQGRLWQRAACGGPRLAGAVLRFCRPQRTQEAGEVAVYSSQPGAAGTGARARAVGVEQLSILCSRWTRSGSGEWTTPGGTETLQKANLRNARSRNPHPLKTAKSLPWAKSKGWGILGCGGANYEKGGPASQA